MHTSWKVTAAAAAGLLITGTVLGTLAVHAQSAPPKPDPSKSSYISVNEEDFATVMARMSAAKASTMKRQMDLLGARYDLGNRPAAGVTMSRGKPIQEGVRVRLPAGTTWDALAKMTPEEIRDKGLFPAGFMPLPHPNHPEGGMVFPKFQIDEIKKQEGRDLTRFDLDFDLPDHFLPEFPPPIYLTTRPDLGDVSQGQARHDRQLLRALQRHPEPEAAGGAAAVADAVSRSSSSTRPRTAGREQAEPRRRLLRLPRERPHERRRRTWSATSARRSSAIASRRRRCAA